MPALIAENSPRRTSRKLRWVGRGVWAVLDQGLFAVSNFALGILLARWLAPEEFGAFTVAYSVFLLLGTAHTALLTEPMLVFGSAKYEKSFITYIGFLLRSHWLLSVSGAGLIAAGALGLWLVESHHLASAFLGMAIASPLILFSWLVRRACFIRIRPQWAAAGGGVYLVVMLLGTYATHRLVGLSSVTALVVIGASSLIAGAAILSRLWSTAPRATDPINSQIILHDHWNYGRWAVGSSVLSWIPGNIYFLLLPTASGLEASGALKALMNPVMPILHAVGALATLLVPSLARVRGQVAFQRMLAVAALLLIGGSLLYWLIVGTFAYSILDVLYDGQYTEHAHLIWIVALIPVSASAVGVLGAALRALERPSAVFRAYVASATVAATVGSASMFALGLTGAILGALLSSMTTGVVLFLIFRSSTMDSIHQES